MLKPFEAKNAQKYEKIRGKEVFTIPCRAKARFIE